MNLEVGTIIRWDNFPLPKFGGENKRRWFICLGSSGIFTQVAIVYLSTTTTQLQHFKGSGQRISHDHFIFQTKQFPVFEQDCAIDFNERPYSLEQVKVDTYKKDISAIGVLDENTMRMIYNSFLISKMISPKELNDIIIVTIWPE